MNATPIPTAWCRVLAIFTDWVTLMPGLTAEEFNAHPPH